jgi:DNA-binding MarR family transcriptional regulator
LLSFDSWNVNKADIKYNDLKQEVMMSRGPAKSVTTGERLLFLTDEQLRQGIELMFFAYRAFTSDPDRILDEFGYGRAHHRALHFINRKPGLTVNDLLEILGVTKQSLNRVLRQLVEDGLVSSTVGRNDRRQRNLNLTPAGSELEGMLSEAQRTRMRRAYSNAGAEAVQGFRHVLEEMIEPETRAVIQAMLEQKDG